MTKQEFLDNLRAALSGRVGASVIAENISYYEDYINTQMRMGKSEEEVVRELGDPRLLARSIADANKRAGMSQTQDMNYEDGRMPEGAGGYTGYGPEEGYRSKTVRMPGWLIAVLVVVCIILIISAVFSVFSLLAPILLPVLLLVFLVRLIRRS